MKKPLFTIKDDATDVHAPPFVQHNEAEARRSVAAAANNHDNQLGQHPKDFSLWNVGTWDDNKGVIEPQAPKFICNVSDLVKKDS